MNRCKYIVVSAIYSLGKQWLNAVKYEPNGWCLTDVEIH